MAGNDSGTPRNNGAYGGFGADWQPSKLSADDARRATDWVEAKIDKRALPVPDDALSGTTGMQLLGWRSEVRPISGRAAIGISSKR